MKGRFTFLSLLAILSFLPTFYSTLSAQVPDTLIVDFSMSENGCVNQAVDTIKYTGNAQENATFTWNFDGAVILYGSGQGPYVVKWETLGLKTVTLIVHWETLVADKSRHIHINPLPELFNMTGGGSYPAGGGGVEVGLSGSQLEVEYKLRRNGYYTNIVINGTGNPISFGLQTEPGTYTAVADNNSCLREMYDTVAVSIIALPFAEICMVKFDTLAQKNMIIWNKIENTLISQVNVYKETSQSDIFEKIAEVPWSSPGIYVDTNSYPLVHSDRYRISFANNSGNETEKSYPHKTIHLNINAGIYGFNLIWNDYEGFDFLTYNIYRKIGTEGYVKIASVASNVDSYTDFYTTSGLVTYYIEVIRPEPCQPELKSGSYDAIVSNTATAAPLGIEDNQKSGVIIYPNPAKDKVIVVLNPKSEKFTTLELFKPNGQLIRTLQTSNVRSELDLSMLTAGIYFLRISSENSLLVRKIIKE